MGSCKLREARSIISSALNPGIGKSDSDLDDLDDGETQPRWTSLTEKHKNAIRMVRKIKYFVARRKFQQARKPYDVRDVIEQYSQGHLNMMMRIKELQRRLDQTLGKPGAYHHGVDRKGNIKPMTIGARLYRLENQVGSVDRKLDGISQMLRGFVQMQHQLQKQAAAASSQQQQLLHPQRGGVASEALQQPSHQQKEEEPE